MKKNKGAIELPSKFLVTVILAVLGLVLALALLYLLSPKGIIDKEACHTSIVVRDSLNLASEKISQASERVKDVNGLAQEKINRAMRKLEKRGIDTNQKWVGVAYDDPAPLKEKAKSGMSEEERLMVLRMLQEKKITVDEAEKLLNALDK